MHRFLRAAQTDGLADEQAGNVYIGNRRAQAEGLAIGKAIHAQRIVDAKALPHQPVHMRLGAGPQPEPGHQIKGDGFAGLPAGWQAVRTRVGGGKGWVALHDVRILDVPVPVLRRDGGGGGIGVQLGNGRECQPVAGQQQRSRFPSTPLVTTRVNG